jgi:uracil phosphoribosyltransferase
MASTSLRNVTVIDHPLIRVRLSRLREKSTPASEFRERLHEIAQLMVYEVTRDFGTVATSIETPMGETEGHVPSRPVILVPILRAGLGMLTGVLAILPEASIGHIGMARDERTHLPEKYYLNIPSRISEADVLLIDPMLATGHSAAAAVSQLKEEGATRIRFICLVSCPEGINHFTATHPDVRIFTAAIDEKLDARAYIVPGLGDAGDRYFGTTG